MPRHLEKRRQGWYAVLNVPADVQPKLCRKRFRISLKTRDERDALRRAMPIIANWQNQIAKARNQTAADDDITVWRETFLKTGDKAESWRRALQNAKTEEQRQSILQQIDYGHPREAQQLIATANNDPVQLNPPKSANGS